MASTPKRGTEGRYDNGIAEDLESSADGFGPGEMTADDHVEFGRALSAARGARKAGAIKRERAAIRARAKKACRGDASAMKRIDAILG